MNVKHPNGILVFMQAETQFMADLDRCGWVTFGYIGGSQALLVDKDEWDAFVVMVAEIDQAKGNKSKAEPFGYWHQGATEEESDFHLFANTPHTECKHCIPLYLRETK